MNYNDILQGLKMLAGTCDGARAIDNQGFNKYDAEFGHSLASKSFLTDKQAEFGKKLIIKYQNQLPADLVNRVKSLEITVHVPSAETAISTLNFSSPKLVKGGTLQLETASPTPAFWSAWKANKDQFKDSGISVTNDKGNWVVNKWTTIGGGINIRTTTNSPETPTIPPTQTRVTIPENVRIKLLEYQPPAVEILAQSLVNNNSAFDGSDCGCHAKETKILMYDGSIKNVEDIVVGDELMGGDSMPRRVLSLKRGRQQMVKVIPIKGDPFIVNRSHVLSLVQINIHNSKTKLFATNNQIIDVSVDEWLKWNKTRQGIFKLFRTPVSCWKETYQPIDPYFIGVLLGDGSLERYPLAVSKPGKAILEICQTQAKIWDSRLVSYGLNSNPTHFFRDGGKLRQEIEKLGINVKCGNKFIPDCYKICSIEQRKAVLAGLLDTDGHLENGCFDFISKSERLSRDVIFVARSLGFAAYLTKCQKGCQNGFVGTYYRVCISGDIASLPLRIKIPNPRKQIKNVLRTGFSVELLEEDDYFGFTVDKDGRYLMGDFTVTHNCGKTYTSLAAAKTLNKKVLVLCRKGAIPGWNRAMNHMGVAGFVTNYEQIKTGNTAWGDWVKKEIEKAGRKETVEVFEWTLPKDFILIMDECHCLRNQKTQNSQMAISAKMQNIPILLLSATAAASPLDMKAIGFILNLFPIKNYWTWAESHGVRKGRWGMEFDGNPYHLKKIHNEIFGAGKGVRLRTKDIPTFPEIQIISEAIDFGCSEKIQAVYDEMQYEIAKLKERTDKDTGNCILTEILRARQKIELLKVPVLAEMAEDLINEGYSVPISLSFKESIHALAKKLNTTCIIDGEHTGEIREKTRVRFQEGKERAIICSILCGSECIDLDDQTGEFPRVSLMNPDFSAIRACQFIGRTHRAKSKTKAIVKFCFAADTIEERARDIVMQKSRNISLLLDDDLSCGLKF